MDDTKKSIILIVDDNFENLQVLGNTLKERGYIPAFAQSGEIALNYLKKKAGFDSFGCDDARNGRL